MTEDESVITTGTNLFVWRLWLLLEDEKNSNFVFWSKSGITFCIPDPELFTRYVIPNYFRHCNFASFVRQLNLYGFTKVINVRLNTVTNSSTWNEFKHIYFKRGHPELLGKIKRKNKIIERKTMDSMIESESIIMHEEHNRDLEQSLAIIQNQNVELKKEIAGLKREVAKQSADFNMFFQFIARLMYHRENNQPPPNNNFFPISSQIRTGLECNVPNFSAQQNRNDLNLLESQDIIPNFKNSQHLMPAQPDLNSQVALYQPNFINTAFNNNPNINNDFIFGGKMRDFSQQKQLPTMNIPDLAFIDDDETTPEVLQNGSLLKRLRKR